MFSQKLLISAISFMGISFCGLACSPAPQSETSQSNEPSLQSLFIGDYIGKTSRGEVYHSIIKLNVPQFGGDIFYHHISLKSLRGPGFQRKIYKFDDSGRHMRSTVLLGPSDAFIDEQTLAESLNRLPEKSLLRFPNDCQFLWTSTKDDYRAVVRRDKCSYESPAFGGFVSPDMEYKLSDCGLVITEGIYREDGSPVFPPSMTNNRRANSKTNKCHETTP